MSFELLRTQIKDLTDWWTDDTDTDRPALLHLLTVQTNPVRMEDSPSSVKSKITGGPAPWDDPVAHYLADVAAGSRRLERSLEYALRFRLTHRGGSYGNTIAALKRLPDLDNALEPTTRHLHQTDIHELRADLRITIGAWHRAALILLGAERRWSVFHATAPETGYMAGIVTRGDVDLTKTTDHRRPCIALCPYCESPVRIQPDLADDGDQQRIPCPECTSHRAEVCTHCTRAAIDKRIDQWELQNGRQADWNAREWIIQTQADVTGCEHVTVYDCAHTRARWTPNLDTTARCMNRDCYEEDDDGTRHGRSWPVNKFLGQLLTWQPDTLTARSA